MAIVKLIVGPYEIARLQKLFAISEHYFPNDQNVRRCDDGQCYELVVDGGRADVILEALERETTDEAFENYPQWKARHDDQGQLDLDHDVEAARTAFG